MPKPLLIIDDDPIFRLIAVRLVKKNLPQKPIFEFENGKQACEYLRKNETAITDAEIFLDINMPVMNGWEFLEACMAEAERPNLYIYVVSSSVNEADREKANSYSFVKGYIEKPLTKEFLASLEN